VDLRIFIPQLAFPVFQVQCFIYHKQIFLPSGNIKRDAFINDVSKLGYKEVPCRVNTEYQVDLKYPPNRLHQVKSSFIKICLIQVISTFGLIIGSAIS